jgi:WD40 repeat protein
MAKIFLSYARSDDEPFVNQLYTDLTAHGFSVWFDRVSMPSRGMTFLQEIRDAIDTSERLILVVGPGALQSDYVRAEWRYALQACKVVTPVLRMGDYTQLTEGLAFSHCPDMRASRSYTEAFAELLRILEQPTLPLGELLGVPSLPAYFLARPEDLEFLRGALLADVNRPTVISSAKQTAALQGMGGVGKSVLAAAFAHECSTRRAFPDGIVWLTAGQQPDLYTLLRQAGHGLGDDLTQYANESDAKTRLAQTLASKNALIILDDIWNLRPAEIVNEVLGERCRLLITTRDGGLVTALGAMERRLDVLEPQAALQLLADWAGKAVEALPGAARDVAEACGYLPFALALCGANARDGAAWADLLAALREADLSFLTQKFPNYPYPDILRALKVSVDLLSNEDPSWAKHYQELAVFPHHQAIPESAVVALWVHTNGLNDRSARKLLTILDRKSLLRIDGEAPQRRVSLHDLQHDYLRAALKDLNGLHLELLAAYQEKCPDGWHTGPDDGYFFERLPYHLAQAGRPAELRGLLLDYRWLEAKLKAVEANTQALVNDYDMLPAGMDDQASQLIQRSLQLSAHILNRDLLQLPSQLTGRLLRFDDHDIQGLLAQVRKSVKYPWFRPLNACLDSPSGALLRTFSGSSKRVHLLSNGRWIVSSGYGGTIEVRDIESGACIFTMAGHTDDVLAFVLESGGRRAISGSKDCTLRLWDMQNGTCIRTLVGHTDAIFFQGVILTPDTQRAVSWSWDKTIKVWNLNTGECICSFFGHTEVARGVVLSTDGKRAISWSLDNKLTVWDLRSGKCIHTLTEHSKGVLGAVFTMDGQRVISWDWDCAIKVWDLDKGECVRTMKQFSPRDVLLTPDGQRAIFRTADGTMKVWDIATGAFINMLEWPPNVSKEAPNYFINNLALSPDGQKVISTLEENGVPLIMIWDLESGERLHILKGHTKDIDAVALTPDGKRAVSGSGDKTLKIWNLDGDICLRTLSGHTSDVSDVIITPDGRRAVSRESYGTIKVWNLESDQGECKFTLRGGDSFIDRIWISADGQRMVSREDAFYKHIYKLWDLITGKCLFTTEEKESKIYELLMPDFRLVNVFRQILEVKDIRTGDHHALAGENNYIECVAFYDGERRGISGSGDGNIHVWDLETETCIKTWKGHEGSVGSVAMTPDGQRVVSKGRQDGAIKLWDIENGTCLLSLEGQDSERTEITMTSDGQRLDSISGTPNNTLKVWSLETGDCLLSLSGEDDIANSNALALGGQRAVSWSEHTIKVWDLASGECIHTLAGHTQEIVTVAGNRDGFQVVSGSRDKTLKVWDLESGACLRTLEGHTGTVTNVILTPDGLRAVSSSKGWNSEDKTVKVWDLDSGTCLRTLVGHDHGVNIIALTPDGQQVISGSGDGILKVWDLQNNQRSAYQHSLLENWEQVNANAQNANGIQGASEGSNNKALPMWSFGSRNYLQPLIDGTMIADIVAITADGLQEVSVREKDILCLRNLENGEYMGMLKEEHPITVVALDPDGKHAFFGSQDGTVNVCPLINNPYFLVMDGLKGSIWALTSDGRRVVTSSDPSWLNETKDYSIYVWETESGRSVGTLEGHQGNVTSIAMTPDGLRLISGSADATIKVWDMENRKCHHTLMEHTDKVTHVAVTPDGRWMVSGSEDATIKVWDLESGKCIRTIMGDKYGIEALALTQDGQWAVSGSYDKKLKVWDLKTGACIHTLEHNSAVLAKFMTVAVTPDGKRAISGAGPSIKVWDLGNGECVRTLEVAEFGELSYAAMTPDGQQAVSLENSTYFPGPLKFWNLENGECIREMKVPGRIGSIALTPDWCKGICTMEWNYKGFYKMLDLQDNGVLHRLKGHTKPVTAIVLTPDGRQIISASEDHSIKVWDLVSGNCLRTFEEDSYRQPALAISPDGRRLVLGDTYKEFIKACDMESGATTYPLQGLVYGVNAMAVTQDGQSILSTGGGLELLDFENQGVVGSFIADVPFNCIAIASDGCTVAVKGEDGTICYLSLENVVSGTPIVTAWDSSGTKAFGCPHCLTWHEISQSFLGTEIPCPNCGTPVRLNPFTFQGDWQPVAAAWKKKGK